MKYLEKIKSLFDKVERIKQTNEENQLAIGYLLAKAVKDVKSIKEAEFKVFSQFGDDGIIQYLINHVNVKAKKFVEFGVETYTESNTRFLLMHDNWKGLVIDGSHKNVNYIKNDPFFWKYDLTAVQSFITVENINQTLLENGFSDEIGLLSVDIDGNDYWVWEAISVVNPSIVVIEYNSLFGVNRAITVPYKADFIRSEGHYSNLYFGASLTALYNLGLEKGYDFVGCNQAGNNAYFVKKELNFSIPVVSVNDGFVIARFREERDEIGNLTYSNAVQRAKAIKGLPIVNTITGSNELI